MQYSDLLKNIGSNCVQMVSINSKSLHLSQIVFSNILQQFINNYKINQYRIRCGLNFIFIMLSKLIFVLGLQLHNFFFIQTMSLNVSKFKSAKFRALFKNELLTSHDANFALFQLLLFKSQL